MKNSDTVGGNMDGTIVYRPYKTQKWALVFSLFLGIFSFVIAGYCLTLFWLASLILAGTGVACIWLTKVLYDSLKKVLFFDQNGLRIIDTCRFDYRYIPWEKLIYGCYTRNYKGHRFLLLSPNALTSKEAKHFANQGANSSRICIEDVVIIYLDALQDVSPIEELISNHITQVDSY